MKTTNKRLTRLERHTVNCILAWTYRYAYAESVETLMGSAQEDEDHKVEYRCDYGTTVVDRMYVMDKLDEMSSEMEDALVVGMKKQMKLGEKETKMGERLLKILDLSMPHEDFDVVDMKIWPDLINAIIKSSSGKEYYLEGPTFKLMMEDFFDTIKDGVCDAK